MVIHQGQHSGFQAINLAYHLGFARIVLVGYDMQVKRGQPTHWFGDHPRPLNNPDSVATWLRHYPPLAEDLKAAGVPVVNASGETALTCFPRLDISALT